MENITDNLLLEELAVDKTLNEILLSTVGVGEDTEFHNVNSLVNSGVPETTTVVRNLKRKNSPEIARTDGPLPKIRRKTPPVQQPKNIFENTRWVLKKGFFDVSPLRPPKDIMKGKVLGVIYKNDQLYRYKTLQQLECLLVLTRYHAYYLFNNNLKFVNGLIQKLERFIFKNYHAQKDKKNSTNPWSVVVHLEHEQIFHDCVTIVKALSDLSLKLGFKYLIEDLGMCSWANLPSDYSVYLIHFTPEEEVYW
jgi:hypothetical protein